MSKVFVYIGLKILKAWLFLYTDWKILINFKNILCLEGKWDPVITVAKWKQDLIWDSKSQFTSHNKHISLKIAASVGTSFKNKRSEEPPNRLDYLDVCAKYYFYLSKDTHYLKEKNYNIVEYIILLCNTDFQEENQSKYFVKYPHKLSKYSGKSWLHPR